MQNQSQVSFNMLKLLRHSRSEINVLGPPPIKERPAGDLSGPCRYPGEGGPPLGLRITYPKRRDRQTAVEWPRRPCAPIKNSRNRVRDNVGSRRTGATLIEVRSHNARGETLTLWSVTVPVSSPPTQPVRACKTKRPPSRPAAPAPQFWGASRLRECVYSGQIGRPLGRRDDRRGRS